MLLEKIEEEKLKNIVMNSNSFNEVCIKLGFDPKIGNIKVNIHRKIKRLGISVEHFETVKKLNNKWNKDKIIKLCKIHKTYKDILLDLDYLPIETNYTKLKRLLNEWNIDFKSKRCKNKEIWEKDYLNNIVSESFSYRDCLKKIKLRNAGGNFKTLKKYIAFYNIDISHFDTKKCLNYRRDISEYLVENSNCSRNNLKRRLLRENIIKNICILCGQDENWNGMKISLILDHINGIYNDNRLENLRIVCPNCNAGLDTFAGKNIKSIKYNI